MFYSRELLSLRRGKFGILWLAATRGTKFITKRDIISFDIENSCLELMEYIAENPTNIAFLQQKKPDMMDIEIPLQSHDDFGSFELPGALYDSQLDWEITGKGFEDSFSLQARIEDITLNEIHMTPKRLVKLNLWQHHNI
nr:unnamed protein product [Spirometra erinaceieuropaei]